MTIPDLVDRDRQAAEDRAEAADNWRRGYFQLRGAFVQTTDSTMIRSGPLAKFVTDRQYRALLLFLMLVSVWPWQVNAKLPLEAHVWMNLLHSRANKSGRALVWSESTLSRTWKYLEKCQLVVKHRGKRGRLYVAPLMENGEGDGYAFPSGEKGNLDEAYFVVPDRFWLREDFAALGLPGLAMLLIIAKETNRDAEWKVTQEQIADWYGISRATVIKGLDELRELGVLETRVDWKPARLSKIRTTSVTYYSLKDEYSTNSRANARANAERRRKRAATRSSGSASAGPMFTAEADQGGDEDETG